MKDTTKGGMMALTVNLFYTGSNGSARKFVEEMESSGIAAGIRAEEGNVTYNYYASLADPETVLLIDAWADQAALDAHHASPMMEQLAALRDKYDLHMQVRRYTDAEDAPQDAAFIRE